ncbi:hypothetical protein CHS0354_028362 [Potamilus streckersoni]|uniref:TASOR pseudo-PARP domain-containing protein n=1 Tax=Potamilus streckersoni TaxID=2493646 RepID=A0AAE0RTT4_9BIVA|nr:hypothetical protein CHS0354_028362 [Potamilus streckersoni]
MLYNTVLILYTDDLVSCFFSSGHLSTTRTMLKQESARIPRRKTEGLLEEVKLNSPEGQSILADVKRTCFDTNYEDKFWKIEKIEIVTNFVLEKRYEDKKRELKEQGRKGKELEEHLMFLSEQGYNLSTVIKDGCKTGTKKRHVLGCTKSGVHLHRNLDILVRFMTFKNFSSPGHIIVFKSILGRSKSLKPMVKSTGATYIEPTPNCDSHVSSEKVQPTMSVCEALNYTYVYFYEYDEDTGLPVVYPRQVVPFAVLTMCRLPGVIHGGPFLAIDSPNWRWEVKGETRNGFRWARVNADSPEVRKGRGKKRERSMPSKDIASLDLDHNMINMVFKRQSVSRYIQKDECTKDSEYSYLTDAAPDPTEEVCIPSEENEISESSCSLSIFKQVQNTKINATERLILPERRCLSESRSHINNSRSENESVRTNNDGSKDRFNHDKCVDQLCHQSNVVATLKTSEIDNKDEKKKLEKNQNSKVSYSKKFKTIRLNSPCGKPVNLHDQSPLFTGSLIKDCPGQKHTEEIIKKVREVLLRNRSIHTSSLASIPFALINPRICLRRVDEDLLKSQQRDHGRLVAGNSSLSTFVSSTKAKEENMSSLLKNEVHTAAEFESVNQQSNSNTNPTSSTRQSPEQVGIFHSSIQLQREEGRLKAGTSPFISTETSYAVGQLQEPPSKKCCLDVGNSLLSTSVSSAKAEDDMSSPVKNDVYTAAKSDSSNKQNNSNTDPAFCARMFPEKVGLFHYSTHPPCEQGRLEISASSIVSPETSCILGELQIPPTNESCLHVGNSSSSTSVISVKAEEDDMSSPVKNDVYAAAKSNSSNKQSTSNTDPTASTGQAPAQVGIFHSSTQLQREEESLETNASLFVSLQTSYIVGQFQKPPSNESYLDIGCSSVSTSVISEQAKEEDMSSPVKNDVYTPTKSASINKQSNSNTVPTTSNRNSPEQAYIFNSSTQLLREEGRLETCASPFVVQEASYVTEQLQKSPSKECGMDLCNSLLSTSVISAKADGDRSPVKNDVYTAEKFDQGIKQSNSNTDLACCTRMFPEMVGLFHSSTQLLREQGRLETMETCESPFVNPETSYIVGQLQKPPSKECCLNVGNTSLSTSVISENSQKENMSFQVKNEVHTSAKFDSVNQQSNSNTDPTCFVRMSPEQVGVFHSSTQFPREEGRLETSVPTFVSLVGQLQNPPSKESCVPQNAYRISTLVNRNIKRQSFITDAHKTNMSETYIKEDTMEKGESLSSVCTKKTDTDIQSNASKSRNVQTYCVDITSTPSIETRIPTRQDSLDISAMDIGQNSHHFRCNQSSSMQTTQCNGKGIKHEKAHFNGPILLQATTSSSLCRASLPPSSSVGNRIPWSVYRSLVRDNCTASGNKNVYTHTENNTLHTAHENVIMDMNNPVSSSLLCMEGKTDKTQGTTISNNPSLCTIAEKIVPVVCNNLATLSEFQLPTFTKDNIGSVFSPNQHLAIRERQSVDSINNREIVFPGDVSTFDRYIIEKAWKRLGKIKQTPEANISDNEMPRKSCVERSKYSYPYTQIPEITNKKVSKDPRLRPRPEINFKDASNVLSHEKIDTDKTLKRDGNLCDLSADKVASTSTFTDFKKGNYTDQKDQTHCSEEEKSDGTPTYDERDYSAGSDFIQGVDHENLSTVPIKPKETVVDSVKPMGLCTDIRVNESVIVGTKRFDDSQQILVTPIKNLCIKSKSSSLKERANKKKAQVDSNSSKEETKGSQVNNYQVEITKTLLQLSAIINEIQSRQEQASKAKDVKSPVLGDVTAGHSIKRRDASTSEESIDNGEKDRFDGSTRTNSVRKNNNFESITSIRSRSSINAPCSKSIISERKDVRNPGKRGNKSLSLIRRYNERAINKYKVLHLSEKNDNAVVNTPENTLQTTPKKVDVQVSFEIDTSFSVKDQCVSSNETNLQTILDKPEFSMDSEKGASTAKEKAQTKSLVASIKTPETEKQCIGVTVETCCTVMNQLQDKTSGSNISTAITSKENIQFDKDTKLLDMANKWRPIVPVGDSKSHETDFSETPSGKCEIETIYCSKPSTNTNKKVRVDRKSNVKVEIVLKSKQFAKDTADDKTNSQIVPSPPGNHEASVKDTADDKTNSPIVPSLPENPGTSTAYDLTFKYSATTSENSLKKISGAEGHFKDVGTACESNSASRIRSDSQSKGHSVNYGKSLPYTDLNSEKEIIQFSKEGVTKPSAIKDSQFSSEWVKEGLPCFSADVSLEKCKQNEDSNLFSIKAESTASKPKVSDTYSNWKRTGALGSNTSDKKKVKVSVSDSDKDFSLQSKVKMYNVSDNKAVQDMDISSNSDSSSDCNEFEKPKAMKKHESRLTDPSKGNVLRNEQGLNSNAYNNGSPSSMKEAKMILKQSVHQGEDNNHKKKLNCFTSKTMDTTKKRLNVSSSGLKDANISIQEASYRVMRDGFTKTGTKTEMNQRKAVDDITKRQETLKVTKFPEKKRFKIESSHEEIQFVKSRVPPKRHFLIDNRGVKKRCVGRDIENPARSSVHGNFGGQTLGKSQNILKQRINIASLSKGNDEDEFSVKNICKSREPFIANEKENSERSASSVRFSSLSSEYYESNPKRRRLDDTRLDRNAERAVSVSSSERHSSVSSHSRNSSLSRSDSGSRNGRESYSDSGELSPIRDSGYIPPRYLNPYFKLGKQFVKQRFSPFHKTSQKQYIEKQKQNVFQEFNYTENLGPKINELYRIERRFVDGRLKCDFQKVRDRNLSPNGPGLKHRGNYITDNDNKFQTRPCKRIVHLPDNNYRNPLEKNFFSRKKSSDEHYANRDFENPNEYCQSSKPLVLNGGFYDFSKRHGYSKLNGRSNGFYGNRCFCLMRAKQKFDNIDAENKNVKLRKRHGYRVHVDDTDQADNNSNSMKAKKKKKAKHKYSINVRSYGCEKQISMDNFPGEKTRFDMNNGKQSNKKRLEHSLYKDKFGALHERLDLRCKKPHAMSGAKLMHLSKKNQISNFDDPERSVRPRIRLRERIFDALERYRNAFESSDPSEVDEEIVRCLNFLCKKIDVSGSDSDTTNHLNRQRRQENKHLERVLHTYPQNVHRQKVSFYEHVVNTIRIMQRHASVTNMPKSIEMVRNQVSLGKKQQTMKHRIPPKIKRKRNVMNNQLKERPNQRFKKQTRHLQMKRKANFDFVNTNFGHGRASFGKQRTGTKTKRNC